MARGRGRGRATVREMGSQRVTADDQAANESPPADSNGTAPVQSHGTAEGQTQCACGMCGTLVGDSSIGCDRCSAWFHPTEICSGLPQEAISLIAAHQADNSVLFVCTGCRVNPGAGSWTRAGRGRNSDRSESNQDVMIKQLYLTVKGLCATVAGLTSKLEAVIGVRCDDPGQAFPPLPPSLSRREPHMPLDMQSGPSPPLGARADTQQSGQYRSLIRQEIQELREREKRKDSIIIRGLTSSSPADVVAEFEEISSLMIGCRVTLSNIVRIPDHPELCRAKILDEGKRKLVLEKAKTLKGTRYDGVFIRRDLTYAQRQDLKLRRDRQNQEVARQTSSHSKTQQPIPNPEGREHQGSSEQHAVAAGSGDQSQDSHPDSDQDQSN